MGIIAELQEMARKLWRGDIVNLSQIVNALNQKINQMITVIMEKQQEGYEFPVEYIQNAINNLNTAMQAEDTYLLADNFYYEWAEIISVYEEWIAEMGA